MKKFFCAGATWTISIVMLGNTYSFKLSSHSLIIIYWYIYSDWRIMSWRYPPSPPLPPSISFFLPRSFPCTKFSVTEVVKGWLSRHWINTLHMSQQSDQIIGWNWRRTTWIGLCITSCADSSLSFHCIACKSRKS